MPFQCKDDRPAIFWTLVLCLIMVVAVLWMTEPEAKRVIREKAIAVQQWMHGNRGK